MRMSTIGLAAIGLLFVQMVPAAAKAPRTGVPYGGKPRTIPGVIQTEDFDTGGEGVAYHDKTPHNEGKGYRPEGPDIKGTDPKDTNRSSDGSPTVGWIFDNEWMAYTVDAKPGVYDLKVRVATPVDTKKMAVSLDDVLLTTVPIPNTGGYAKWQTVVVEKVKIGGGKGKVLKLLSTVKSPEEFDINWIEFVERK